MDRKLWDWRKLLLLLVRKNCKIIFRKFKSKLILTNFRPNQFRPILYSNKFDQFFGLKQIVVKFESKLIFVKIEQKKKFRFGQFWITINIGYFRIWNKSLSILDRNKCFINYKLYYIFGNFEIILNFRLQSFNVMSIIDQISFCKLRTKSWLSNFYAKSMLVNFLHIFNISILKQF